MKKYYYICNKLICIEAESFPGSNPMWEQFESQGGCADINIACRVCGSFPDVTGETIGRAGDHYVSAEGGSVYRSMPMGTLPGALTCYTPADTSFSETFFTEKSFPIMMDSRYMWASLSFAQLMLYKKAFFLHSSYIAVGGKAVLFSAACGVGKSTQAALWEKHRSARVINGDKAGVLVDGGGYACGVPFCGTSGICQNETLPLGAIVLLSQGKENEVRRLVGLEALRGVLENVYLDLLAPGEQGAIIDLLIELFKTVPVYSFACTADESAVDVLEEALHGVI